jgi:hypothetical protein
MIYWALGPFVRYFILLVDPGDICPPQDPTPLFLDAQCLTLGGRGRLGLSRGRLGQGRDLLGLGRVVGLD